MRKFDQISFFERLTFCAAFILISGGGVPSALAREVRTGDGDNLRLTAFKKPMGIKAGSFLLRQGIKQGFGATDNANEASVEPLKDGFSYTKASLRLQSDWDRHELDFSFSHKRQDFFKYSRESSQESKFSATGIADLSKQTSLTGHIDRKFKKDPDSDDGRENRNETQASIRLKHKMGKIRLIASLDGFDADYEKIETGSGKIEDERNYYQYGGRLRGAYDFTSDLRGFVEVRLNKRKFRRKIDDDGNLRGSQGIGAFAGFKASIKPALTMGGAIGYRYQKMRSAVFKDTGAVVVDGWVQWKATKSTWLTFEAETTVDETTSDSASQLVNREIRFLVQHNFNERIGIKSEIALGRDVYVDSLDSRKENYLLVSLEPFVTLNRYTTLSMLLEHNRLFSNVSGDNIKESKVTVALKMEN